MSGGEKEREWEEGETGGVKNNKRGSHGWELVYRDSGGAKIKIYLWRRLLLII
jgi:hypothetical protein